MKYFIKSAFFFHSTEEVEIDSQEFTTLSECMHALDDIENLNLMFRILFKSYLDFEKALIDISFENKFLTHKVTYGLENRFTEFAEMVNLKLMGFLSISRSYNEQKLTFLKANVAKLNANQKHLINAFKLLRDKSEHSFEVSIVELVRNIGQHSSLPIETFSYGMKSEKFRKGTRNHHKFGLFFDREKLINGDHVADHFKPTISQLEMLSSNKLDALYILRIYMDELFKIHDQTLKALKPILEDSEKYVKKYLAIVPLGDQVHGTQIEFQVFDENQVSKLYVSQGNLENCVKYFADTKRLKFDPNSYISNALHEYPEAYPYNKTTTQP